MMSLALALGFLTSSCPLLTPKLSTPQASSNQPLSQPSTQRHLPRGHLSQAIHHSLLLLRARRAARGRARTLRLLPRIERASHPPAHDLPAEEANPNHKHPARRRGKEPQHVAQRLREAPLRDPAVDRVQEARVLLRLEVHLLRVHFDHVLRGGGGAVDGHDVQTRGAGGGPGGEGGRAAGGLGNGEVPERGEGCGPGGAEDGFFGAVDEAKAGGVRSGGEEGDGFLITPVISPVCLSPFLISSTESYTHIPQPIHRLTSPKAARVVPAADDDDPV